MIYFGYKVWFNLVIV